MNIAYTVNGEGMGHASRSGVIINYLQSRGHRVEVFVAGTRAISSGGRTPLSYLEKVCGSATALSGLHMVYRANKIRRVQTAIRALGNAKSIRADMRSIREQLARNTPELVITDFDFHGELISRFYRVPLVSIDNVQYITQAKVRVAPEDFVDYELNYMVAKMMVPRADHYIITTFNTPKIRRGKNQGKVFFAPPILRDQVIGATPRRGDHILVYQTSDSYHRLLEILAHSTERFVVYNTRSSVASDNITYRGFDEAAFIADLATAKAVIVNGGFNVIAESLYFRKPILSVPIRNHFEQKLNAALLEERGFGMQVRRLTGIGLRRFVRGLNRYEARINEMQFDNSVVFKELDRVLAKFQQRGAPRSRPD